jgi:Asp/Glu/hydantoin racemase
MRVWPEAQLVNVLDDSLSADRAVADRLTPAMHERIGSLARYGIDLGAAGILYTCSAFGEAIEAARANASIPILKPNEAMFEEALASGTRIAMLATFRPSILSMEKEFAEMVEVRGLEASLQSSWVADAMNALRSGDAVKHNRLLAEAAAKLTGYDALMLAQFSMAQAHADVSAVVDCPVFTSPGSAVVKLKRAITQQ